MADPEDPTPPILPGQTFGPVVVPSQPATRFAKAASDSLPIGIDEGVAPIVVGQSGRYDSSPSLPLAPPVPAAPLVIVRAADGIAVGEATAQGVGEAVRTQVRQRPVEAMLHDPLGEVARKERRSLLGISAIAILVGRTGLVPSKIENFGIVFAAPERRILLWLFFGIVAYYTAAFMVYAASDGLSYLHTVYQGSIALRKQREEGPLGSVSLEPTGSSRVDAPWSLVGYVTLASLARGVFDFIVPVLVAGFALWSLWGAVAQVRTAAPPTPATSPAPSLKTAPAPATR